MQLYKTIIVMLVILCGLLANTRRLESSGNLITSDCLVVFTDQSANTSVVETYEDMTELAIEEIPYVEAIYKLQTIEEESALPFNGC